MNNTMQFFLSFLAVLILITGTVMADGESGSVLPIQGTITQLTSGECLHTSPVISDQYVVWEDYSNDMYGREWERNSDITGYDWYFKKPLEILEEPSRQVVPAISGPRVVWQDNRRTNWDIWTYDIKTGCDLEICQMYADQISPDIDEWTIVWEDSRSYSSDIFGYDLVRLQEFPICTDPGEQIDPGVSGQMVVWVDDRNGNPDIYGYNTETKEEFAICRNLDEQVHPDISGDTVVWEDSRSGTTQIYSYSIATGEETILSPGPGGQYHPRISGDYVIFEDDRSGDLDIYLYDIITDHLFQVTSGSADQKQPDIYKDKIVWMEEHKTAIPSSDIYMMEPDFSYISGETYQTDEIGIEQACRDSGLTAAFTSDVREGIVPCKACYTDLSCGDHDSWIWRFGDGGVSIDPNPCYIYTKPGIFTVSLTARNGTVSDTKVITDYFTVTEQQCENVSLQEGWNLFSVPDYPVEGYDIMQIFGQIPALGHSMFGFDPCNKTWIRLQPGENISPYKAFFVFSGAQAQVRICYGGNVSENTGPSLYQGWNLVGFKKATPDSGTSVGQVPPKGWQFIVGFNATDQQYTDIITPGGETPVSLDPGSGYWIFMGGPADLSADLNQSVLSVLKP